MVKVNLRSSAHIRCKTQWPPPPPPHFTFHQQRISLSGLKVSEGQVSWKVETFQLCLLGKKRCSEIKCSGGGGVTVSVFIFLPDTPGQMTIFLLFTARPRYLYLSTRQMKEMCNQTTKPVAAVPHKLGQTDTNCTGQYFININYLYLLNFPPSATAVIALRSKNCFW